MSRRRTAASKPAAANSAASQRPAPAAPTGQKIRHAPTPRQKILLALALIALVAWLAVLAVLAAS